MFNNILNNIVQYQSNSSEPDQVANLSKHASFMIVDEEGIIHYKSDSCSIEFDPQKQIKSLAEVHSDPDISLIVKGMKYNKTDRLSLDLLFFFLNDTEVKDYIVQINRIVLMNNRFYLLLFDERKVYKVFENKINTLQHALEKGNIPVLIADQEYRIRYVTQNFEDILDRNIEDLYDKSILEILLNYLSESDEIVLLQALETHKPWSKVINISDPKKGNPFYDLSVTPIFDSSFRKWDYILSAYDITDHILKNRALKKDEARLRGIINNISDALFVIKKNNSDISFEIGNDNFYELFKIDKNKFDPNSFEEIIDPDFWQTINKSFLLMQFENKKQNTYKFQNKAIDKYFEINTTFVESKFDDEHYYIVTLRDITIKENYEKHLESAYQKEREVNKLKTLILHNMSHELRTPANAIIGYTDIIDDSIETKDYETVSQITHSIKDILTKLINLFTNIIELSSIESGEYELDIVRINCNQILQSVYNKRFGSAMEKNLDFTLSMGEKSLYIKTDWIKFEKIIKELVDNAIKFTKNGKVKIESYLDKSSDVVIKIIDTGVGISESNITNILEPFQQEGEFYTRSCEGNGLGLTISHKLTKILGGEFHIASNKKKGTILTLTFPSVSSKPTIEL